MDPKKHRKYNPPSQAELNKLWGEYARRTETYKQFKKGGKAEEVKFWEKENVVRRRRIHGDPTAFNESHDPRRRVIFWAKPWLPSLDQMEKEEEKEPIRDCVEDIETEIDFIIDLLKIEKGKKASLEDLKRELINSLKTSFVTRDFFQRLYPYPMTRYYSVSLYPYKTAKELANLFQKVIQRELSNPEYKKHVRPRGRRKPLHFQYLWDCLKIYDLAIKKKVSGLKWKEIGAKVWPDRKGDLRQATLQAFKRAKEIIQNVEKGILPGK